jgi:integrase
LLLLTEANARTLAGPGGNELDARLLESILNFQNRRDRSSVPLTPGVCHVLLDAPHVGDLIFTTTGETPMSGFGKVKARLDARISAARSADGLPPMPTWTFHDLRRTLVTIMNEKLGVAPHVVEAVVNHTSGLAKAGVAGVYNRALYFEDRRRALHAWDMWMKAIAST